MPSFGASWQFRYPNPNRHLGARLLQPLPGRLVLLLLRVRVRVRVRARRLRLRRVEPRLQLRGARLG